MGSLGDDFLSCRPYAKCGIMILILAADARFSVSIIKNNSIKSSLTLLMLFERCMYPNLEWFLQFLRSFHCTEILNILKFTEIQSQFFCNIFGQVWV